MAFWISLDGRVSSQAMTLMSAPLSSLLATPPLHDGVHVEVRRAVFPLCVEVHVIAVRRRVRFVELKPRRKWDGLPEDQCFAPSQACKNADQVSLALGDDATDIGLIVGIRDPQTDERAALGEDRFGDFVGPLAD